MNDAMEYKYEGYEEFNYIECPSCYYYGKDYVVEYMEIFDTEAICCVNCGAWIDFREVDRDESE